MTMENATTEFKPATIGEELYLVHLQRHAGDKPREEDFDHLSPRKRFHDVGEELWEVHLKRSRGLAPDIDTAERDRKDEEAKMASVPKNACPYNLRSKDGRKCTR
jgi:hypothetical protein